MPVQSTPITLPYPSSPLSLIPRILKTAIKPLLAVFLCFALVLLAEFIFALYILSQPDDGQPADAIVVFAGSRPRIAEGYHLARNGRADKLLISPAAENHIAAYSKRYGSGEIYTHIIEPAARTTFENALLSARLLRRLNVKRVLLATSAYHMPRSFLLLKLMLAGDNVRIIPVQVKTGQASPLAYIRSNWKIMYNEMVKTWGSLFEAAWYKMTGHLPIQNPKKNQISRFLKSILLFKAPLPA